MIIPEHDKPSILIVRLSAIGDIVFASPLIHALRQRYPRARISWLVQPESKALLEHHPELDDVVIWPRSRWQALWKARRWLALWREVASFRRSLQEREFDLALDVQGLLKSGLLTWFSGAGQRIGLGSREGSQYLMTSTVEKGGEPRRIGSEYLYLAEQLHLPVERFEMHVGLSDEDRGYADQLIEKHQLERGFVLICPFTTRPQKHWFNASWQALIEQIAANWQLPVVMLGGPGDRQPAAEIKVSGEGLINLVGETSLRQAAALIARGSLVVGVDTGLTHIGIAMNRPTLCLFGSTRPYLDTTHENAQVIYHPRSCSPCKRKPTCQGSFDCMAEITAAEVVARANRLPGFSGGGQ
ncbi:MAG: glycosyltransferase family 9 protein [Candidatus Thiodiazotropha taylori]|uniref:Glycosyltransferase family 9 protein n=1 Tax=Candidatus Thiodiazotropha taylori TaxID=2792791 RepID=A0A9E4KHS0_9GAMM|nr:glycosyltransferase family 9 protein [Candidatus Thiodiazotropha taylori]MCW4257779.1 glycosyltransferase family 9 protein [Candidatus Thiodiazotropha taylori]